MFEIMNLSSPVRTQGSDWDIQVSVSQWVWWALRRVGIGKVNEQGSLWVSLYRLDLFIVDWTQAPPCAQAVRRNIAIMNAWSPRMLTSYAREKEEISNLDGPARKQAKALLAIRFGLDPKVYW